MSSDTFDENRDPGDAAAAVQPIAQAAADGAAEAAQAATEGAENAVEAVEAGPEVVGAAFERGAALVEAASEGAGPAADRVADGLSASADALARYNAKVVEAMRDSAASTTALFAALIQAKSVPEAMAINADHMRRRMEALTSQGRELANLAQAVVLGALQPPKERTGR